MERHDMEGVELYNHSFWLMILIPIRSRKAKRA
jgi:hypothetical protein